MKPQTMCSCQVWEPTMPEQDLSFISLSSTNVCLPVPHMTWDPLTASRDQNQVTAPQQLHKNVPQLHNNKTGISRSIVPLFYFPPHPWSTWWIPCSTVLAGNHLTVNEVKNLPQVWTFHCSIPLGRSKMVWVKDIGNIWHQISKWKNSISSFFSLLLESSCLEEQ